MSKLLGEVRDLVRTRHYSYRTEEAYLSFGLDNTSCFTASGTLPRWELSKSAHS
jgi:hypothetical protein